MYITLLIIFGAILLLSGFAFVVVSILEIEDKPLWPAMAVIAFLFIGFWGIVVSTILRVIGKIQ